jgi:hypothetical protein
VPTAQEGIFPMRLVGNKVVLRQGPDDGDTMPDTDAPSPLRVQEAGWGLLQETFDVEQAFLVGGGRGASPVRRIPGSAYTEAGQRRSAFLTRLCRFLGGGCGPGARAPICSRLLQIGDAYGRSPRYFPIRRGVC